MSVHTAARGGVGRLSASPDGHDTDTAGIRSATTGTPNGFRSSPPMLADSTAMDIDPPNSSLEDAAGKSDSEAETIVLPGKDGHSPSKIRQSIKHEDKSDDEEASDAKVSRLDVRSEDPRGVKRRPSEITTAVSTLGKRKRPKHLNPSGDSIHHGNSSGLSSVPTSPVTTTRSSLSKPTATDSEISKSPSPRLTNRSAARDKAKSVDRALPRRKHTDPESEEEDEIEERRFVRPRSGTKSNFDVKPRKAARSQSPQSRSHRRSISTQLPAKSSHGLSHKKKRVPAPLQSTEYQSDESSGSGSSVLRSSRLRSLAAPNTGDSTMSPVKMGAHRKHVNPSGQTQFSLACQKDKLELVKKIYAESPEDLNVADHAQNTPLHTASLAGYAKVVAFLLKTGRCIVDPLNEAKDTPLHDALENGHIEVVELLLKAGANPRKQKADGKDLLDIITENEKYARDEDDDAAVIEWAKMRDLVAPAMKKFVDVPQDSENDRVQENTDSRLSHPVESPRHTPPIPSREFSGSSTTRRVGVGTSRQVKTKDGNLYQPMNVAELRKAAKDGDYNTTARILEVMGVVNDVKSAWLAARGGYDDILSLHLAIGGYQPFSDSLDDVEIGKATPFLVAIGRGNNHLRVLKLILAQPTFDPTRLVDGETYFQIAQKRKGPNWHEEVSLLKDAFEKYKPPKSSPGKPRSPGVRRDMREVDRDGRRSLRNDEHQTSRSHKRTTSSPKIKEPEPTSSRHRRNSSLDHPKDGQHIKRGPGRPRKEEGAVPAAANSDRENSPVQTKQKLPKKSEPDSAATSDTETTAKPRKRLISGREYRGERDLEKQRRASVASNISSASLKEKRDHRPGDTKTEKPDGRASPSIARMHSKHSDLDTPEKALADKDRARSLKRDDSKDRLSAIRGESPVKRPRKSETPPRSGTQDSGEGGPKRRKLDGESNHKPDNTPSSSPDHHTVKTKSNLSRDSSTVRSRVDVNHKHSRKMTSHGDVVKDSKKSQITKDHNQSLTSLAPKQSHSSTSDSTGKPTKSSHTRPTEKSPEEVAAAIKLKKEEAASESRARRERDELDLARKLEEETNELARIEEAKQARLIREKAAKDEEEKREREEAERKERQRIEDAEARARAAEQQRALYVEQERIKREEQDRRRAIMLEQQRAEKIKLEKQKEEERLARLPYLLRWFDTCEEPKTPEIAAIFQTIQGYRYDTIKPEQTGQPNGREQWMLNTHVAILLGEKDLQLSRYTAWERIPLTDSMKQGYWRSQNDWITLQNFSLPLALRKHFPTNDISRHELQDMNKRLFLGLELFFVKVSEFMYVVHSFPHLRAIELHVQYREMILPAAATSLVSPVLGQKYKSDPDFNHVGPPPTKVFIDGALNREIQPSHTKLLNGPPPGDDRVPRRLLVRVEPGEADYELLCRQQGLHHLLPDRLIIPKSPKVADLAPQPLQNGFTPPGSDASKSINGGSPHLISTTETQSAHSLTNGVR